MSLNNKSILIIDNDAQTLKMLEIIFKSAGGRVLLERDCKGASRVLDQIRPDVIILNLNEIDMADSVYCEHIKERFSKLAIPIIVTSTIPVSQYKERLSYLSEIHYFQKPYSSLNLLSTAFEVLGIPIPTNEVRTFNLRAE